MYKNPLIIVLFFILIYLSLGSRCIAREEESILPVFQPEVLFHGKDVYRKGGKQKKDIYLPFVSNGFLYVYSMNLQMPIWRIFIGGDLQKPFVLLDSKLYFYDIYNRIYSVEVKDSSIDWITQLDGEIEGSPIYYDNFLIVGTQNGNIFVIDRISGIVMKKYSFNSELGNGVFRYKGIGILPFKNGRVVGYSIESGNMLWEFLADGIIVAKPIIKYGVVYFGAWDETFYAVDVYTGKLVWSTYIGENLARDFLVFSKWIVLFLSQGEIITLSRETGEIKWVKYYRNIEFSSNYFQGKDKFFVFMPEVVAVDPEDGSIIYKYGDRAFDMYKNALFDMMIEAEEPLTDEKKERLLKEVYFNVSNYPLLHPLYYDDHFVYFVAEDSYLYIFDIDKEFFIERYKLE